MVAESATMSFYLQKTTKTASVSTFIPWPSFYRAMHFSAKRGIVVFLSVRL